MFDSRCISLPLESRKTCANNQEEKRHRTVLSVSQTQQGNCLTSSSGNTCCYSPKQDGLKAERSTIDIIEETIQTVKLADAYCRRVVLPVTLYVTNAAVVPDARGAGKSYPHSRIPFARILRDYLNDGTLLYEIRK